MKEHSMSISTISSRRVILGSLACTVLMVATSRAIAKEDEEVEKSRTAWRDYVAKEFVVGQSWDRVFELMSLRCCEVRRAVDPRRNWPEENLTVEVLVDDYSQIDFPFDAERKLMSAPTVRPKPRLLRFPDGKVHAILEDTIKKPKSWERIGPINSLDRDLKTRAEAAAIKRVAAHSPPTSPEKFRAMGSSRRMVAGQWQWVTWIGPPSDGPVAPGFPFRVTIMDNGEIKEFRALGY
jgi:hypothetical protein